MAALQYSPLRTSPAHADDRRPVSARRDITVCARTFKKFSPISPQNFVPFFSKNPPKNCPDKYQSTHPQIPKKMDPGRRGVGRGSLIEALKRKALSQSLGESTQQPTAPVSSPPSPSGSGTSQVSAVASPAIQVPVAAPRVSLPTRSIPGQFPTRSIPSIPPGQSPQVPTRAIPGGGVPRMPTRSAPPGNESQAVPKAPAAAETIAQSDSAGRGRATLLESALRCAPTAGVASGAPGPRMALGRASLIGRFAVPSPVALPPQQNLKTAEVPAKSAPTSSGDNLGVTGSLAGLNIDDTSAGSGSDLSAPVSRMGTTGEPVEIMSNYLNLKISEGKGIYRYETRFDPETDSPRVRNTLLNQHLELLGKCKIFDGVMLYIPNRLSEEQSSLKATRHDGIVVTITLIFQRQQRPSESIQFFNILLGKVMKCLQMVRINRSNFNPRCAHKVEQHKMELWPGYITAIEEVEDGLKLNIDASHRVMRTDTVRDYMTELMRQTRDKGNFRDAVVQELLGMTILTRYNNETYRIDDIHWDKNPLFTFDCKGKETSLAEYYKSHWNIDIVDLKQPLLYHKAKKKLPQGGTQESEVLLIPELCYLTGLTDKIRNNFRIMRDLATITQVLPEHRRQVIRKFVQDVKNCTVANAMLKYWGLEVADDLVRLRGRVLPPEVIHFGNGGNFKTNDKADWGRAATTSALLRTDGLKNWFICFTERDQRIAEEFVKMLKRVGSTMKMDFGNPQKVALRNDSTGNYVQEIRKAINPELEMVVAVVPTVRLDRYSAIKKVCCVECPIKSQVVVTKTISDERKLKAVAEKIAIQMACKLGGAPWALVIPFDNVMVVGVDVYHAGAGQPKVGSVVGFVASLDKAMTSWYSTTGIQGPHQEFIDLLQFCMASSLKAYKRRRGILPDRIMIFRDGVGDGQLPVVADYEVPQMKKAFESTEAGYKPKLTVIIVQKRINTRVMALRGNNLQNPGPGTIVDSVVTRRNWYDFFLVPQTAKQGTVTPTHYIVLLDEAGFQTDHLQRLSYKLCHLYYNWPGTIRVPAPCQYAHKLAYLIGQNVQARPDEILAESLYYL